MPQWICRMTCRSNHLSFSHEFHAYASVWAFSSRLYILTCLKGLWALVLACSFLLFPRLAHGQDVINRDPRINKTPGLPGAGWLLSKGELVMTTVRERGRRWFMFWRNRPKDEDSSLEYFFLKQNWFMFWSNHPQAFVVVHVAKQLMKPLLWVNRAHVVGPG
jgi:hypothetical protein